MKRLIYPSMAIVLLIGLLPAATAAQQPATDEPDISVTPASLSAEQCADTQTTQTLQICNVGSVGELYWGVREGIGAFLSEGFEGGVVPPAGWTLVQNSSKTWRIEQVHKHTGQYAAQVDWDYNQDEWLLSPQLTLSQALLTFYSTGSTKWCRDQYDWCDLNVWIVVGDVGGGDDVYVGKADPDWWTGHLVNLSHFDLTGLLPGGPVRLGFQYWGNYAEWAALDDIALDPGLPWLSKSGPRNGILWPGECQDVIVGFDSTGLAPGVYSGSLAVDSTDPDAPLVTVPVEMTVLAPPSNAGFSWAPSSPIANQVATFTATAQGIGTLTYAWDFGDGETGTGNPATHTYAAPGDYTVTVTVSNACGSTQAQHSVHVYAGPQIRVQDASLSAQQCPGTQTSQALQVCNDGDLDLVWARTAAPAWASTNPAGGTVAQGNCQQVAVGFDSTGLAPGPYTGTLRLSSNDPAHPTSDISLILTVLAPPGNAGFSWAPPNPIVNEQVTFTGTAQGSQPLAYAWDFGDGGSATGNPATHAYSVAGNYPVVLTVSNTCGSAQVQHTVTVAPGVQFMHVGSVDLRYVARHGGKYVVSGQVLILSASGAAVPRATVYVEWTRPDGSVMLQSARTSNKGLAAFKTSTQQAGLWQLCVTDVTKAGWTYDPDSNLETCAQVILP